jgi:hypothetical protein
MYAAKMMKERSSMLNISDNVMTTIMSLWHFGSTPSLDNYVKNGAHYDEMTPDVLDEMIDVICTKYGYDSLYRFYSLFLPRDVPFTFTIDSDAKQATVFVAALSAATGVDLRPQFKEWGFPIDDKFYSGIWNEVNRLVNQRARAISPAPSKQTPPKSLLILQSSPPFNATGVDVELVKLYFPHASLASRCAAYIVVGGPLANPNSISVAEKSGVSFGRDYMKINGSIYRSEWRHVDYALILIKGETMYVMGTHRYGTKAALLWLSKSPLFDSYVIIKWMDVNGNGDVDMEEISEVVRI